MESENYNNRKRTIYLPIAFAIVMVAGFLLGAALVRVSSINKNIGLIQNLQSNKYDPVNDVLGYIMQDYVDSVDASKLKQYAVEGILENLDPHSQFIPAEEFNEVNEPLMGGFDGIGVQFRIENDSVYIINTIQGGPSEKAGVRAGDRIIRVNNKKVAGVHIDNREVMKLLKGQRGTKVNVSIFRKGSAKLLSFNITRDVIPTYSVDVSFMPEPGTGYIKLSKFAATTSEELTNALLSLKAKGMKQCVLDLRGNSGGYLQSAIDVADQFLPERDLIVYTEGYNRPKETAYATANGLFEKGKLVVLIDEGSASSAEIVAGALQDNDRATIIGRRSFGKGLVQEQLSLPDGSAVRLTVARYFTPSGRSIQKPYEHGHDAEYESELYARMMHGEFESQDSIHFNDSLKFKTKGGKVVYGGGGIMPDIFIPIDRSDKNKYYNSILNKGLIHQFTFEYTDKNRQQLNRYGSFDAFNKRFSITPEIMTEFTRYAEKEGVPFDPQGLAANRSEITNLMKALIGRNIFDEKGFYPIYLKTDKAFNKALEQFKTNAVLTKK
ncbi:MAG TPA: S41 family peptidase [Lentimicrobium sp.]|nr:S41 family peptidase [Lentimicrobium sp.]